MQMYNKSFLANGLRVVTEAMPYVKSVSLGIWIGSGSRSESTETLGASHFIEHMLFKGTEKRTAREISETVDAVGGQLNAFTAKEHTCYYIKVLDTHVELAMDVLSDMLTGSLFCPEEIEKEKEVVLEEINMYEDTPDELIHDLFVDQAWSGHPLGRSILGDADAVKRLERDILIRFKNRHYTPDNIVVAAAGNLKHETIVALAEKYLGHLKGSSVRESSPVPQITPALSIYGKDTEQVHFCLGTIGVPQNSEEIYAVHVLNNILGGGTSSRLFQSIREERGLAYSVYSYQASYSDAGLFAVYAGTRPNNLNMVVDLVLQDIARLKAEKPTMEELIRSKEQLKSGLLLGLESSSSRMSRLGKTEITLSRYIPLEELIDKVDKVTLSDLTELLEKMFVRENLCFTALGPIEGKDLPSSLQPV